MRGRSVLAAVVAVGAALLPFALSKVGRRRQQVIEGLWTAQRRTTKKCACWSNNKAVLCEGETGALACAELVRDYGGSGWADLRISTRMAPREAQFEHVARAAGFAEGAVTAAEIAELRARFQGGSLRSAEDQKTVMEFAKQQWPAVEQATAEAVKRLRAGQPPEPRGPSSLGSAGVAQASEETAGGEEAYWTAAAAVVQQLRGVAEGYASQHNAMASKEEELQAESGDEQEDVPEYLSGVAAAWKPVSDDEALWAMVALNYDVDAFDVTDCVEGGHAFAPLGPAGYSAIGSGTNAMSTDGSVDGGQEGTAGEQLQTQSGEEDDGNGGRFASASAAPSTRRQSARLARLEDARFTADTWARRSLRGRCTAAVLATPACRTAAAPTGQCDVLLSHATWANYAEALRIHKTADWSGLLAPHSKLPLPATHIAYTSYPGMVASTDDWIQTSARLALTETTIGAAEPAAVGDLITTTPEFSAEASEAATAAVAPQPFPMFLRSMAAAMAASTGTQWTRLMAARASGTGNSQWLVVDYKQLQSEGSSSNRAGLFSVLEQTPRRSLAADATALLLAPSSTDGGLDGVWPSANRPLFAPARLDLGYPGEIVASPAVRAAARAMGVELPPSSQDGSAASGQKASFSNLWELRIGDRRTDVEEAEAAQTAEGVEDGKVEGEAPLALTSTTDLTKAASSSSPSSSTGEHHHSQDGPARFRQLLHGSASSPWLRLGRLRHAQQHHTAAPSQQLSLSPPTLQTAGAAASSEEAPMRFAALHASTHDDLAHHHHHAHHHTHNQRHQGTASLAAVRPAATVTTPAASSPFAAARQEAAHRQLHRLLHPSTAAADDEAGGSSSGGNEGEAGPAYYSFDANPRSKQVRLAAQSNSMTTTLEALRLARLNTWPLRPSLASRPYFAPAARFDLAADDDAARQAFGAIEGKATSAEQNVALQTLSVVGPTRGIGWRSSGQGAEEQLVVMEQPQAQPLPPFDWRRFDAEGVCGQETNPATETPGLPPKARQCSCGPQWAFSVLQLPCGWEFGEKEPRDDVPRAVLLGGQHK